MDAAHHYSLELETQQIWDYVGDKYVHRLNQSKGDSKLVTVNSRCTATEGECTTCGDDEDSSFSGALFSSKVDSVFFSLFSHIILVSQRLFDNSLGSFIIGNPSISCPLLGGFIFFYHLSYLEAN